MADVNASLVFASKTVMLTMGIAVVQNYVVLNALASARISMVHLTSTLRYSGCRGTLVMMFFVSIDSFERWFSQPQFSVGAAKTLGHTRRRLIRLGVETACAARRSSESKWSYGGFVLLPGGDFEPSRYLCPPPADRA